MKNNQDSDLNDKNLTNLDSITVNRAPKLDNELSNKKYVDSELQKNTLVRFNQRLENYPKISVSNDTYNLTKYDKIQITDITNIKTKSGGYLLQNWALKANDKNNKSKISNFFK